MNVERGEGKAFLIGHALIDAMAEHFNIIIARNTGHHIATVHRQAAAIVSIVSARRATAEFCNDSAGKTP